MLLPSTVLPVIELAFDPVAQVGDWHIRIQTLALAGVILVALLLAALVAGRTPLDRSRPADAINADDGEANHLRRDDLLYLAVAAIPGAVIGGRLGYWLIHPGYYGANPAAILDPAQGGFELSLAVVGGTITAAVVASLLGTPVGRWMHALILPLLLALAGGKATMILGGQGQGAPWDGPWATAYLGPGPWLSLAPAVPSHPAQAYEALATLVIAGVVWLAVSRGAFAGQGAGAFLLGVAAWAIARALVAFTWRDPAVFGPLSAAQALAIGIAIVAILLLVLLPAVGAPRRRGGAPGDAGGDDGGRAVQSASRTTRDGAPDWPDPASRPRI